MYKINHKSNNLVILFFFSKVAESFGNAPFGSAPVQVPHEQEKVLPLQKPPKWIRKPVGASFAVSLVDIYIKFSLKFY